MKSENRKFSFRSFFSGLLIGSALVTASYFTYLLVTNDETEPEALKSRSFPHQEFPSLYEIAGFSGLMGDSSFQSIDSLYYQSKWLYLISQAGYREMDSLFIDSVIRRMYFDSLSAAGNVNADTMVLQNDRQIASKNIVVTVQKILFSKEDTSDADDYVYSQTKHKIEFWESPIRYRGYKRSGNHSVLYGIKPGSVQHYIQLDNQLFIREGQIWYQLVNTDQFAVYSPVTNEKMLHRLELALKHR